MPRLARIYGIYFCAAKHAHVNVRYTRAHDERRVGNENERTGPKIFIKPKTDLTGQYSAPNMLMLSNIGAKTLLSRRPSVFHDSFAAGISSH